MMTSTTRTNPLRLSLTRVDFGLLLTLGLCGFALWPLLYRAGLPNGNDVLYHVYRAAEMDRAWSHSVLLPRWAEAFYTGYGSPLFHYYASLSYYISSFLMRVLGLTALDSMRALIVLGVFAAGGGMYQFVSGRIGSLGGTIAALCYVYCPYMLFTEPYSRGAYPEFAALALFPVVVWRFDRLLKTSRGRDIIFAALSLAALILMHNLMGLSLTMLLVAWLIWELLSHLLTAGRSALRPYWLSLGTAGLGIGLAAYFWIPVILESGEVRLDNLTAVAQLYYANFFVPLHKLLALSPRFDAGAINGLQHQFNLGLPQWVLALTGFAGVIGLLWIGRRKAIEPQRGQRTQSEEKTDFLSPQSSILSPSFSPRTSHLAPSTVFFALAGGACVLLMLPLAAGIWAVIVPLAALQFPWRFLGAAGFCLAVLAGMNALWIERLPGRVSRILGITILVAIVGFAMPLFYITEWDHPIVDTSVAAYQGAEVRGLQRATTFSNEYLPRAVEVEPDPTESLLADYADGYPVNHLNPTALPAGVEANLLDNGPQFSLWQVSASTPFTMEVLIYDFAGWKAEVDGQTVPITPSNPHGLITFPVPEGQHTVRLDLGSTPPRDLGVGLTVLAVFGLALLSWKRRANHTLQQSEFLGVSSQVSILIATFLIILGLVIVYMREGIAWVKSPPGSALLAENQTIYHLGDNIQLLGYDLNGDTFRPGDTIELTVYWYTDTPIPYGYASFVHVSTGGAPLAQADKQNPAGRPTKEWTSDGYIRDDYTIVLPDTMPTGEYSLMIGLYTCDTLPEGECGNGDRLPVTDASGNAVGDTVPLQTITVR